MRTNRRAGGLATRVRVRLGEFARDSLASSGPRRVPLAERIDAAVRFYLAAPRTTPGWRYPPPLLGTEDHGEEIDLSIDPDLWAELSTEAKAQRIASPQLLAHAILFCIAQADADVWGLAL